MLQFNQDENQLKSQQGYPPVQGMSMMMQQHTTRPAYLAHAPAMTIPPSVSLQWQQLQQQQQQQLKQPQKLGEQPPKKKTKQRFKEINKKESEGNLMDAYVDKPPPPEPVVQETPKPVEVVPKEVEKPEEDLSWEDKGEKISDKIEIKKENEIEPVTTEQTRRKYGREFLLQFQFMPVCTIKPAGLPDIEVVLDAPVQPSKMTAPRGPDFLPSYARQKSQGAGGRRDSHGKTQPRKIITPVHQPPVELKKSENRWTRPQEKEQELCEDGSDGWIVTGRSDKCVQVDANKLKSMSKRADADEKISLRPSGQSLVGFRHSGCGSTGETCYNLLNKSENRRTRPHEREQELSEDEKKTAELYRIVISVLNKLTPQKFKVLFKQIMQLDIDTPERLEGVIDRIFEKAINEPMFSVAYANMCWCLFLIKVGGRLERDVSLPKLLLIRYEKEFEKERQVRKDLEEKITQVEGLSEKERKQIKEEIDEEAAKNRRRMLGNMKFIGELFKLKLLTENIMHDCISKLLRAGNEESLESMCILVFSIGKLLDSDKAKPHIQQYFDQINKIIIGKKISSRVCFMLRDVVDLRKNNWVPRPEKHYNPKAIDQIHKIIQMEQRNANLSKKTGGSGQDSLFQMTGGSDGWIVTGRSDKCVQVDANKLKSMSKRTDADEKISLSSSGQSLVGFRHSGCGSTGGTCYNLLNKSENRWTRPHEREQELSEDEKKTAELYRIVTSILNKLTPQKFKTLVEQTMQLDIDTPERLQGVVERIFEKAIREPVFSVAYANMCRCLFSIKVSGPDDRDVSFRKLLLNRCQKEFEKEKQEEKDLEEKMAQLEGLSEGERKLKKEEMDEEAGKNKRRMLGNIKFIGELFKLKLLTENIMHDCIFKLLRAGDEKSLESMCKLLFTIGKDLDSDKAKPRIQQYFDQINKIITGKKISSRVCFMLRDVVDLRKNNWVPRREEHYNPKTIDQIHKDAQMEQRNANLPKETGKPKKSVSGRDSPKPQMTGGSDGWIVTGRSNKPVQVDANKLKSMGKRANVDGNISLGPSGRSLGGFGQWQRGSTGGSTPPQEQEHQGNRFSALSGGGDGLPSNHPYDPRKSSSAGASRPSSAGSRPSDKRQVKSDKESALDAVRSHTAKPQSNIKPEVSQATANTKEKTETKVSKEDKEGVEQQKELLSNDEMVKKTKPIVDEFVNIEDMEEALRCFTDLDSPHIHDVFVTTAVEHTYDMKFKARKLTGCLLSELLQQDKLEKEQFTKGLSAALENAEDNATVYPKLWCYLAEIITPVIVRPNFKLSDLEPLVIKHLFDSGKAGVLVAEILNVVAEEFSEDKAISVWADSNISWSDILPTYVDFNEFLSRKNLTFLLCEIDEVRKLLSEESVRNDEVFACIEKNFKVERRKEPEFICQLASAVAESCIVNEEGGEGPDCCVERLKERKNIIHKYLDNNKALELQVLFSLQKLYAKHNKPTKMLGTFFNTLYDEDVITEESFYAWKNDNDPARQDAKGPALQATASFFDWLQAAVVE